MLMSARLPLPERIYSTGWWTVRGEKISKSMPATRVDPNALADDIGVDALRYYLLREVPLGLDGDFAYENLVGRYNAELAHDLGNLVSRALTVAEKFAGGAVPTSAAAADRPSDAALRSVASTAIQQAAAHYRAFAPSKALEAIWRLVGETNRYVNDTQPWKMAKMPGQEAALAETIRLLLESIACAAQMASPVMPGSAARILALIGGDPALAGRWPAEETFGAQLTAGAPVGKSEILFPRIDDDRLAALLDKWIPPDARTLADPAAPAAGKRADKAQGQKAQGQKGKADKAEPKATTDAGAPGKAKASSRPPAEVPEGMVSFQEFGRLDLRVAQVVEAAPVEGATKLLRLLLDVGEPTPRQVVAGIAETYRPDQLVGRKVIFLANLAPATIRGVTSQGMVLAAGAERVLGLSAVDADVPVGTKVR
jgi:methionyl-tRNA synthetase